MMEGENKNAPLQAKSKAVAPRLYVSTCGTIQMPSEMITTKERFLKIWRGKCKGKDINKLWLEAEKWRNSFK